MLAGVSGLIFQENDHDFVWLFALLLGMALLWYYLEDCNVAISGVCMCMSRGKPAALFSLPCPQSLFFGSLSFPVPLIFSAGELWDVDKSLDSGNNREPERKRGLLSCVAVTAYITVCSG